MYGKIWKYGYYIKKYAKEFIELMLHIQRIIVYYIKCTIKYTFNIFTYVKAYMKPKNYTKIQN